MSVTMIFPDGKREACVTEVCEAMPGEWEANVAEEDGGVTLQLAKQPLCVDAAICEPSSELDTYTLGMKVVPQDANSSKLISWFGDAHSSEIFSEQDFSDEHPLMAFTIFGKNHPCRWIFAIAYASQLGRTINGFADKAQESSGFYRGFSADGEPTLNDNINIGFVVDPAVKFVVLELARQVLKRKFNVCYFKPPPPKTPAPQPVPESVPPVSNLERRWVQLEPRYEGPGVLEIIALSVMGAIICVSGGCGALLQPRAAGVGGVYMDPYGSGAFDPSYSGPI